MNARTTSYVFDLDRFMSFEGKTGPYLLYACVRIKSVPSSYYRTLPPPPPGYRMGYYDGYVVAYNPTTQIIADVLDLVDAAVNR